MEAYTIPPDLVRRALAAPLPKKPPALDPSGINPAVLTNFSFPTLACLCISSIYSVVEQVAQLSQTGRAMLRVIKYFAKSLKVIRNDTVA